MPTNRCEVPGCKKPGPFTLQRCPMHYHRLRRGSAYADVAGKAKRPAGEVRNERITVWLTKKEHARLEKSAMDAGQSVTAWVVSKLSL